MGSYLVTFAVNLALSFFAIDPPMGIFSLMDRYISLVRKMKSADADP